MKKTYDKPRVMIERFSNVHTGARDCADHLPKEFINLSDVPQCKWDLGSDLSLFLQLSDCTIDGEGYMDVCYNNPSENMLMFRS